MSSAPLQENASLESLVAQVVDEFVERQKHGEQPEVEEYAARYPQAAMILRKVLASLQLLGLSASAGVAESAVADEGSITGILGDFRILHEIGRGGMGIVYEAQQVSLGRHVALKVLPFAAAMDSKQLQRFKNEAQAAAHLHHTNIVPVYAVGCERGVHYYAMQYIEGRTVAALIRELRQLARLEAPGPSGLAAPANAVVCGLTSGRWAPPKSSGGEMKRPCDSEPATDLYPALSPPDTPTPSPPRDATTPVGPTSTERSTNSPAFFRTVAHLGVQAAEALEHAHTKGIIHRDIKPANLLIDMSGNVWITDFGLARMLSEAGLTMTGDLLGTLRYMSPEQALAKRVPLDHRTDIYSLGVTLYELLTLQPAYDGRDRQEILQQIAFEEPRLPRRLNKTIPTELETIVRKAMAKNPAERYATAQELADDLRRFLDDKPIKAKRPTLLDWTRKWARRHPGVVGTGIAGLIVAVGILAVSTLMVLSAYRETVTALYGSYLREAEAVRLARRDGYRARAWQLLHDARQLDTPEKDVNQLRQEAVACLGDFVGLKPIIWTDFPAEITAIALSPKGGPLAIGLSNGTVLLRDSRTGADLASLEQHRCAVSALTFAPDGARFVSGDCRGTLRVWQANADGKWALSRTIHAAPAVIGLIPPLASPLLLPQLDFPTIKFLAISPDGKHLAASLFFSPTPSHALPRTISLWNLADGTPAASFGQESEWLFSPAFSPDGKFLAAAYCRTARNGISIETQHGVLVRDLGGGGVLRDLPLGTACILKVDYSPDGKHLACTCAKGLALFETSHFQPPRFTRENYMPFAFIPGRPVLAIANYLLGQVRLWNFATESDVAVLRHFNTLGDQLQWIACSSDIVVVASPRTVQMWNLTGSGEKLVLAGHAKGIPGIAFSPDGTLLASAGKDNEVRIWDPATGQLLQRLTDFSAEVQTLAFSGDGRMLATGDWAGVIQIREVLPRTESAASSNQVIGRPIWSAGPDDHGMGRHLWAVAISPDGHYVAASGGLDTPLEKEPGGVIVWRIKPDGAHGTTRHLEMERPRQLSNRTGCLAFSPDSQLLAWVEQDNLVRLWDLEASRAQPFPPVRLAGGNLCLAFHAATKHLIFVADTGLPEARDVRTGQRVFAFAGKGSRQSGWDGNIALSSDGAWLASTHGTFLTVRDKASSTPLVEMPEEQAIIYCLAWCPNKKLLAVGFSDGGLVLWNLPKMKEQLDAIGLGW